VSTAHSCLTAHATQLENWKGVDSETPMRPLPALAVHSTRRASMSPRIQHGIAAGRPQFENQADALNPDLFLDSKPDCQTDDHPFHSLVRSMLAKGQEDGVSKAHHGVASRTSVQGRRRRLLPDRVVSGRHGLAEHVHLPVPQLRVPPAILILDGVRMILPTTVLEHDGRQEKFFGR